MPSESPETSTTAETDPNDRRGEPNKRRHHIANIGRAATSYKRKKTSTACQVCRARRTKCDDARPCTSCREHGYECIASTADVPHWDAGTLRILSRIDDLEGQLASLTRTVAHSSHDTRSVASTVHETASAGPGLCITSPDRLFPQNLEKVLQWTALQQLPNVSTVRRDSSYAKLSARSNTTAQLHSPDLEYSTCRGLLNAFFAYVHPKNPILDEPGTHLAVKKACFDGFHWDTDHALLLVILAIGALAMPFGSNQQQISSPDLQYAESLYDASTKRFGSRTGRDYLSEAKWLFYSGVYLMSTLKPFDAWRTFLQALAVCQGLQSLSQSPDVEPSESRRQSEESLYWSCWKSEREVRIELGLPDFGTNGSDHPQMYPSLPKGYEDEALRAWYFYLAEISLWRMETSARNEIAEVAARGDADLDKLAALANQLREPLDSWVSSLPRSLAIDGREDQEPEILRFVLRGRLTYVHELLTWPFVHAAIHSPSMPASAAVEKLVVDGLSLHLTRLVINRPGFYHQHHGTWLMMRSSARSACILLVAALTRNTARHLPHLWSEAVWATIEMLHYWNQQGGGLDSVANFLHREMTRLRVERPG